jgi:putative oxidoreductase
MLQRFATGTVLIHAAVTHFYATSQVGQPGLHVIDVAAGLLIIVGLWTPVAGAIVATSELWFFLSGGDPWMSLLLATLGATLAMIGPGAWSIDARLFGRRQIKRLH